MRRVLTIVIATLLIALVAGEAEAIGQKRKRRPRGDGSDGCRGPVCARVTADRTTVFAGDSVTFHAMASDPSGAVLKFVWNTTAGRIVGAGPNVMLDTTGIEAP